jgi:NTP pyrophosphatase (non-canonical NTP hydrolase)
MEFSNYQNQAKRTAIYPNQHSFNGLLYLVLGLTGESGEVANNIKKCIRDDNGVLTAERHAKIIDELGDVLWYVTMLCYELEIPLETIAIRNLAKLKKRQRENTLHDKNRNDI